MLQNGNTAAQTESLGNLHGGLADHEHMSVLKLCPWAHGTNISGFVCKQEANLYIFLHYFETVHV